MYLKKKILCLILNWEDLSLKSDVCMPMFLQEVIGRNFFLWYFWSWCDACCFTCCMNASSLLLSLELHASFWEGLLMVFFFCLFFAYMDISCVGTWCSSTKTQFLSKSRGWGWKSSTISPHISSWENIFLWTQSSWTV